MPSAGSAACDASASSAADPRSPPARDLVRVYAQHYNEHRPHRSLAQRPPLAKPPPIGERAPSDEPLQLDRLRRRDRLGGLLHEYELTA